MVCWAGRFSSVACEPVLVDAIATPLPGSWAGVVVSNPSKRRMSRPTRQLAVRCAPVSSSRRLTQTEVASTAPPLSDGPFPSRGRITCSHLRFGGELAITAVCVRGDPNLLEARVVCILTTLRLGCWLWAGLA
jgi:hypothetical protein